jgi:hypothetical protein
MQRDILIAWTVCIIVAALTLAARAQYTLDANFDSGSLKSYSVAGNTINLVGRDNYYHTGLGYPADSWRWLNFDATGVLNTIPTFSIRGDLFAGDGTDGPHELSDHEMVYSYDNQNWFFFDNNTLTPTPTDPKGHLVSPTQFAFSNNTPFTQNNVYVAYAIPYSYGKSVAHSQTVLTSQWVTPTASGNTYHAAHPTAPLGVIGQSAAGTDDLGRAVPALNIYAYRITNPATDSPAVAKRKIMISSSLHAGETLGTYTYEGLVNWLISDDPRAARLRNIAEVDAYPMLNPAGRYAGNSRTTVGNVNRDPNGLWDSTQWSNSSVGCGGTNCQDIRVLGTSMLTDVQATPGFLDAFIDFHSTVPDYTIDPASDPANNVWGSPDDFTYVNPADVNTDWFVNLHSLQPGLLTYQSTSGSFTSTGYARRILDKRAAGVTPRVTEITLETAFSWERNIDYYHDLGEKVGIAFYEAWVPQVAGDFTGDGIVDSRDFVVWRDEVGQTGSALQADGNQDGVVDISDYNLWRSHFGQVAASGTGQAAAVPEPATLITVVCATIFWLGRRCRQRV